MFLTQIEVFTAEPRSLVSHEQQPETIPVVGVRGVGGRGGEGYTVQNRFQMHKSTRAKRPTWLAEAVVTAAGCVCVLCEVDLLHNKFTE